MPRKYDLGCEISSSSLVSASGQQEFEFSSGHTNRGSGVQRRLKTSGDAFGFFLRKLVEGFGVFLASARHPNVRIFPYMGKM